MSNRNNTTPEPVTSIEQHDTDYSNVTSMDIDAGEVFLHVPNGAILLAHEIIMTQWRYYMCEETPEDKMVWEEFQEELEDWGIELDDYVADMDDRTQKQSPAVERKR